MKRGIVILAFVALIFFLATLETIHVNNAFEELGCEYSKLAPLLEKNKDTDVPECIEKVDNLTNMWNEKKKIFSVYIPHNSLIELNLKVTRLAATVKCNDQTMALIELEDLITTFPEYNNRYLPSLYNIL